MSMSETKADAALLDATAPAPDSPPLRCHTPNPAPPADDDDEDEEDEANRGSGGSIDPEDDEGDFDDDDDDEDETLWTRHSVDRAGCR
jgi:hypothetical protein